MSGNLDFIDPSRICIIPEGASKQEALDQIVALLEGNPHIDDLEKVRQAVFEREAIQSTGLGNGVAVPHVRIPEVQALTIALGIAPDGSDFDALDNNPVQIIVLFATPKDAKKTYLCFLAQVMVALRNRNTFASLASCRTVEQVRALL